MQIISVTNVREDITTCSVNSETLISISSLDEMGKFSERHDLPNVMLEEIRQKFIFDKGSKVICLSKIVLKTNQ